MTTVRATPEPILPRVAPRRLRLFVLLASHGARRHASYRAATAAGAFTNSVFGLIRAFVLVEVWRQRPDLGGYDAADAVTYVFLGQALIAAMAVFDLGFDLPARIRTGAVVVDLYRPVGFQAYWLAGDLGRAAVVLATRGGPPMLVGALVFDLSLPPPTLAPRQSGPPGLVTWALFAVAVVLGLLVSFGLRYLFALACFWLLDDVGLVAAYVLLSLLLTGMTIPLVILPDGVRAVAYAQPFAALVQVPADVLVGASAGADAAVALAGQAAWALALFGLGAVLTRLATRKVVVQGG